MYPEKQSRDGKPGLSGACTTVQDHMAPDSVALSPPQCLGWVE